VSLLLPLNVYGKWITGDPANQMREINIWYSRFTIQLISYLWWVVCL